MRWRRNLHSTATAAADDGAIDVIASDLHELDAATGETNWQAHLPSEGTAAPIVADNVVLAATGGIMAFRRDADDTFSSNCKQWRSSSVNATSYSSPVIAAGRIFVVDPGGLQVIQPTKDDWNRDFHGFFDDTET